ncbi:MAG: nucleoside deaminase [Chloroflexi bacterium]|nr:nucleoside deaminase [Chloroflexota bacterium]
MDKFMQYALEEAHKSFQEGGIPIGAVLVRNGVVLGRGHNRRVQENSPIFHAEIVCIHNAGRIKTYENTIMYSTMMPCYFCGGAIIQFGIPMVVSGETFHGSGSRDLLRSFGVTIEEYDFKECISLMNSFIAKFPEIWQEDCGVR